MNLPWKKADSGNAKNKPRKPHLVFEISLGGAIVYVLIIVVLFLIIWSTQRERESHVRVPDFRSFEQALPSIANLTGAPILAGNSAEVLQNGDGFFPPLFDDIAQAKESIHFETYVWWKGEICDRLAHTLAAKARDGVEVRMTLDATGSNKGDDELFEEMEKAGVKISYYHPIRIQDIGLINNRTHRKVAVIDGKVAYVFGHGMAQEWTGNGQDEEHWRDTGVRLEGPIVNAVQGTFAENWVEMTAEVVAGDKYFPRLAAAGDVRAHVTATSPNGGVARLELLYKLAIASAQKELIIANPYFIPDQELVDLLGRAVKRGVDVKVMVPGKVTDSSVVRHAGHAQFEQLVRRGVKIFEYQKTLNHQKIMIIDGIWSQVGSANFDDRSLDINDEASVGLIDSSVAAQLENAFEKDLRDCTQVDLETWNQRSLWHKLEDKFSYAINEQL
ncbi:MAG TPA: phospholipase D-like domain-containing protein [Thermoanaerobaculia bacterium]|nr:phospholipase D-like domain-containing protein [Thermoanaerobaculia bacterium]